MATKKTTPAKSQKAAKKKPVEKRKKNGDPHPTTTGKVVNVQADQTNWRNKLQLSRLKFDDSKKDIYIAALADRGKKGMAAEAAGVCLHLVRDHMKNDPDFGEAVENAINTYDDKISEEVRRRGHDGYLEPVYQKGMQALVSVVDPETGEILYDENTGKPRMKLAYIRKYSDRMLELEAKRVNPGYRDKQTIDLNSAGTGVLVAPADMTPEAWIADQKAKNENAKSPMQRREEAEKQETG